MYQAPETCFTKAHLSRVTSLWISAAQRTLADLKKANVPLRTLVAKPPKVFWGKVTVGKGTDEEALTERAVQLEEFENKLGELKTKMERMASADTIIKRGDKKDEIDRTKFLDFVKNAGIDSPNYYGARLACAICAFYKLEWPEMMERVKNHYIDMLDNGTEWKVIDAPISETDFKVEITPVNQLFHETFAAHKLTGFCSMANKLSIDPKKEEQKRASNLWLSKFKDGEGKTLFECFRSGTISYPFGDAEPGLRQQIGIAKAKETLTAMLVRHLQRAVEEKRDQYVADVLAGKTAPVVRVVNCNVQTPVDKKTLMAKLAGDVVEMQSIKEHMASLKHFDGESKEDFVIQWEGEEKRLRPHFVIVAFNFGVNGAADSKLFEPGIKYQKPHNDEEMQVFKAIYDEFIEHHLDSPSFFPSVDALTYASGLWGQITEKLHEVQTYGTPARITNLAHMMGCLVHFNCKSGKDRTSVLALESHFLAWQIKTQQKVPAYENLISTTDERHMHRKLIFESGNLELQALNTGLPGYKIVPMKAMEKSLYARFGRHLVLAQGLCREVKVALKYTGSPLIAKKSVRRKHKDLKPRDFIKIAEKLVAPEEG